MNTNQNHFENGFEKKTNQQNCSMTECKLLLVGWLYLGFNATLTAKFIAQRSVTHMCFPGFLTPVLIQLSFQSRRLLFSYAKEVRGKSSLERKFTSTGCRIHNHQVMSQTHSPLIHPGRANCCKIQTVQIKKKATKRF